MHEYAYTRVAGAVTITGMTEETVAALKTAIEADADRRQRLVKKLARQLEALA